MATKKVKKEEKRDISSEINIDEIKIEIVDYAKKSVDSKIDELVRKADRRLISAKNRSIFRRNIIILILLCLSLFLTYLLYNEGYFDKFFNHNNNDIVVDVPKDETPVPEPKESEETKLDKLKKEYANLLDNIIISEDNNYLVDLYNGKLTNKLKLSIAIANISKDKVTQDEDVYTITEEDIKNEYGKLFNIEKYKASSFELDSMEVKYLKAGSMYLFYEPIDVESHIRREITGINVKDNTVKITVYEGYIVDNILYNITSKEVVNEKSISIIENCKKLNKVTYVFEKVKDSYILSGLEV
jgi:hypothetical protein